MPSRKPSKHVVREPVALHDAKLHLSSLGDRASAGEEIVITKAGQPLARLIPLEALRANRVPGQGKGRWRVSKDFDSPLPDHLLGAFAGR